MQIVERWILARLRHHRFFSLAEVNTAIATLLTELNDRPFKKLPGCRRSAFAALDAPYLRPLPASPYVLAEWKRARVNIDYHVEFEHHYYSVPHQLVRQEVELRITRGTLEVLAHGRRVASQPPIRLLLIGHDHAKSSVTFREIRRVAAGLQATSPISICE